MHALSACIVLRYREEGFAIVTILVLPLRTSWAPFLCGLRHASRRRSFNYSPSWLQKAKRHSMTKGKRLPGSSQSARARSTSAVSAGICYPRASLPLGCDHQCYTRAGRCSIGGTKGSHWRREGYAAIISEECRLELVGDVWMHHGTVAVPLNVCCQTLQMLAEVHLHNLPACQFPLVESLQLPFYLQGILMGDHVDEGITQASTALEVEWHVCKVVPASKPLGRQQLQ